MARRWQAKRLGHSATGDADKPVADLFTVYTGTVSGIPAKREAIRHSFARCELGPSTLPMTISWMACRSHSKFSNPEHQLCSLQRPIAKALRTPGETHLHRDPAAAKCSNASDSRQAHYNGPRGQDCGALDLVAIPSP